MEHVNSEINSFSSVKDQYQTGADWLESAWNGVRLLTPREWYPREIGANYLLFFHDGGPALELKWEGIAGRFSHHRQLRKLAAGQERRFKKILKIMDMPTEWEETLHAFDAMGFHWRTGGAAGRGVILYCAECKQASMIQFHGPVSSTSADTERFILSSFQDHNDESERLWAMFDLRAHVPRQYFLVRHRFEPGRFTLEFKNKKDKSESLRLFRWGAASIHLQHGDLERFARSAGLLPESNRAVKTTLSEGRLEWETAWDVIPGRGSWRRIMRRSGHERGRLWHLESKNRILGLHMSSRRQAPSDVFERVMKNYGCL